MVAAQKAQVTGKEEFHFHEAQRMPTDKEADVIYHAHLGAATDVFFKLVRLRTTRKVAFPSKIYLQRLCGFRSHNTLNKHLAVLEDHGLIRVIAKKWRENDGRYRTKWLYFFPMATGFRALEFHDGRDEKKHTPPPSFIDNKELKGDPRIKNNIPCGKPHIPAESPQPEPESAVFFHVETKETTQTTQKESQTALPEALVLREDSEKSEGEVLAEIDALVLSVQKRCDSRLAKSLKDDTLVLNKNFGCRSVLTAIKCLLESQAPVFNPGGWIRSHLKTPAWLLRFMEKIDQRAIDQVNQKEAEIRARARREEQHELDTRALKENQDIARVLDSLSTEERRKLEKDAEERIPAGCALLARKVTRLALVRELVRVRFLGLESPKVS